LVYCTTWFILKSKIYDSSVDFRSEALSGPFCQKGLVRSGAPAALPGRPSSRDLGSGFRGSGWSPVQKIGPLVVWPTF